MHAKKLIVSVIALGTPIVNFAGSTEPGVWSTCGD